MPARLAAMPRIPPTGALCIGARVIERLTSAAARGGTTGAGPGLGLTTPVNPMFPKDRGTSGACAAVGAATATARATGAAVLTLMAGVAAEAGRAREATMAPEMTMTAEALLAGLDVREIASEKHEAELNGLGARWRPVFWLDTVGTSPYAYEVSCRVRVGDCTRPSRRRINRSRPPPRELHPKERLTTPQMWVPRSCQAEVESLECGDRTRRTASSTPPKMTKPDDHTQAAATCHISIAGAWISPIRVGRRGYRSATAAPVHLPCTRLSFVCTRS